jgi:hypothetical protein
MHGALKSLLQLLNSKLVLMGMCQQQLCDEVDVRPKKTVTDGQQTLSSPLVPLSCCATP